ncbi:MAG: hypothetical protein H0U74_06950 [Bradymonadaceae bacterium]|nr:hypothetical protein [Lujinxingiaceae bacterium]
MTSQALTLWERQILQRHFDGELEMAERAQAAHLLESKASARVFLAALEELTIAVRAAEEAAWQSAPSLSSEAISELAHTSGELSALALADLAPLLERFFDGEADHVEALVVAALIEEREDVAAYLEGLDELRSGLRGAQADITAGVDFGGLWSAIDRRLDLQAFDAQEHTVLLYRFHDNQVSASERALVEAWLAAGEPAVLTTITALAELNVAVNASVELAQERADLTELWTGIEARLDESEPKQLPAAPVVSLAAERDRRRNVTRSLGALAAAITLLFMGGLLADRFFQSETVIIKERTVVIVDSVEHAPGASVRINSPVEQASHDGESDFPTIIWLLDADDESQDGDETSTKRNGPI